MVLFGRSMDLLSPPTCISSTALVTSRDLTTFCAWVWIFGQVEFGLMRDIMAPKSISTQHTWVGEIHNAVTCITELETKGRGLFVESTEHQLHLGGDSCGEDTLHHLHRWNSASTELHSLPNVSGDTILFADIVLPSITLWLLPNPSTPVFVVLTKRGETKILFSTTAVQSCGVVCMKLRARRGPMELPGKNKCYMQAIRSTKVNI